MKARLNILEALRKQAAAYKSIAPADEAAEAALMEQELSDRIKKIRESEPGAEKPTENNNKQGA